MLEILSQRCSYSSLGARTCRLRANPDLGPGRRVDALAEDLELVEDQIARVILSPPDDEVFVAHGIERDRRLPGVEFGIIVVPHVAYPEIVDPDLGPGGAHSLEVAQIAKSIAIRLNSTEEYLKQEGCAIY